MSVRKREIVKWYGLFGKYYNVQTIVDFNTGVSDQLSDQSDDLRYMEIELELCINICID